MFLCNVYNLMGLSTYTLVKPATTVYVLRLIHHLQRFPLALFIYFSLISFWSVGILCLKRIFVIVDTIFSLFYHVNLLYSSHSLWIYTTCKLGNWCVPPCRVLSIFISSIAYAVLVLSKQRSKCLYIWMKLKKKRLDYQTWIKCALQINLLFENIWDGKN